MACGSGRHSVELAELGYAVDAFDTSTAMIEVAENLAKERRVNVAFTVVDMLQISKRYSESYDLILCLGNSLALLPSMQAIAQVTSMVSNLLSENGAFVFQTLNFNEISVSGFSQFEPKSGVLVTNEEVIFRRHFDHSEENSDTTTLVLSSSVKRNNEWIESTTHQNVLRVNFPILKETLEKSGFEHLEVYSNYNGHAFIEDSSRSIVVRARKQI
jgi:2-polyprenyl-3-methyl-5-hydroxy-6-metoxy-1,4-benzoquinol methylase